MDYNIDTVAATQPTLNIDLGVAPPQPPSDEVAKTRAYKAHMGLGDILRQDQDQIYRGIASGQEDALRESAALEITSKALEDRHQRLVDMAAQKGSNLTLSDVQSLNEAPVNPKAVIEQAYSRSYVNTVNDSAARIDDNILDDAKAQDPKAVDDYMNKGSDILSNKEYAVTKAQNLKADLDKKPHYEFQDPLGITHRSPTDLDFKQLLSLGFYEGYVLRKNLDTKSTDFLGNILDNKAKQLLLLPPDQFQPEVDRLTDALRGYDDDLAYKFLQSIQGMTTKDKFLTSAWEVINLATLGIARPRGNLTSRPPVEGGPLAPGPDGVYRPGGGGPTAPNNAPPTSPSGPPALLEADNTNLNRAAMTAQEVLRTSLGPDKVAKVQQVINDILKSSSAPEVTKATIAEGSGDIQEAAVQKTISSVSRPDPIKEATDTLLSLHRTDTASNRASPGNLSREDHTRLLDAAAGFESNTVQLLTDSARVMRLPSLAEEGFRSIAERIRDYFPGRENTIMDIGVRYEPVSNTHHYDVRVGNYGAVPFSSYELAARHAEINGYDTKGIEGQGGVKVFLPAAALLENQHFDTFKTAKGSTYELHPDGTTTRDKAARPEHPNDSGVKDRSTKTFYITETEYQAYKNSNTRHFDGTDLFLDKKNKVTISPRGEPKVGLVPVEIWNDGKKASVHFGNKITEVGGGTRKVPSHFEVKRLPDGSFQFTNKNGVEINPDANPSPGMIPYNLTTNKFEPALTGQTTHIEQQGLGFHIVVSIPVNETEDFIRNGLVTAKKAQSSSNVDTNKLTSIANAILGPIRNPYDTLSQVENENRAKVVFGQSKFIDLVKNEIKDVEDIYKGMIGNNGVLIEKPLSYIRTVTGSARTIAKDFTRALTISQTMPDPKTELPGYYMKTPAEIQAFWQQYFKRPATFKEQAAYLSVGRIDHFDHILRNMQSYTFKARLGTEQWTFFTSKDGTRTASPTFEAVQIKAVNASRDEVTLIHNADGTEKYFHSMGTEAQNKFREDVKEGRYVGVEIFDPEKRPINRQDIQGNTLRIRYVFSNTFTRKPLSFDQMGYRGGGHWQYDYEHAVKQPIIRTQWVGGKLQHIYEGDTTHSFVANRAMGEQFALAMNEIARLIKARQLKTARDYAKTVFDQEWKDIYKGFRPSKNPITGELTPPRFSTDPRQAFRVVPMNKTIRDLDKEMELKFNRTSKSGKEQSTFVDGTRHGSLARNFQVEYSSPRDSYAMTEATNVGTVDKPFYQYRPAELTDPIATMIRAVNRIVNSTYMNDLKLSSIEHWLEENKGLIDATLAEIRGSPMYYFNEGKFKIHSDNALQVSNAMSNRYKIQQLLGMPSFVDTVIQGVKQSLSDTRYEARTKTKKIVTAPLVAPEWMLDHIHHPIDFLRGMTFHLNLGLFAVKQVVVQSMAYTTIYGLAGPVKATQGSYAALMHQWSRINKSTGIIDEMDRRALQFGWKVGEFKEASHILERTGFGTIGNELSLDNGLSKQTFFKSDAKAFLGLGQIPFNEGNLHVRFGAWFVAFKEYRDKHPHTKIGPVEEGQILRRANILNGTMTRDANTILNKGLVGVPFQFYDYMKKMADLFWGKNLGENFSETLLKNTGKTRDKSKGEEDTYYVGSNNSAAKRAYVRLRMFAFYAMLGGISGLIGATGLPFGDTLRKAAISSELPFQTGPYIKGDNVWWTMFMEGPTSVLINELTGVYYNFNNRFNPNGIQVLRDVFQTDPTFWKIVLGATGTTVGKEVSSLSGFASAIYSMAVGDPAFEAWPLKNDDWIDLFKNIKSFDDATRLRYALAYGVWRDTHGRTISDITVPDAIFRTITGLNDQNIDDKYIMDQIQKDNKRAFQRAANEYQEQRRLAERAAEDGNKSQADDYNKRAIFALTRNQVPIEMWPEIMARDAMMNRGTLETTEESYFTKFVPEDKKQSFLRAYERLNQLKKK